MEKTNIVLIGMPGVGKSSVGVVLAKTLGMDFTDTDLVIMQRTGKKLRELIAERGREGFLALENDVIASLSLRNTVIATGGSAVFGGRAMARLREDGIVVYLAIGVPDLAKRLGDLDARGVVRAPGQSLGDIYAERAPLYERYADLTILEAGAELRLGDTITRTERAVEQYRLRSED